MNSEKAAAQDANTLNNRELMLITSPDALRFNPSVKVHATFLNGTSPVQDDRSQTYSDEHTDSDNEVTKAEDPICGAGTNE